MKYRGVLFLLGTIGIFFLLWPYLAMLRVTPCLMLRGHTQQCVGAKKGQGWNLGLLCGKLVLDL